MSGKANETQTAVRFPEDVMRRIDAVAKKMTAERPGVRVTRAAVIRLFVLRGLEEEKEKSKRLANGAGT